MIGHLGLAVMTLGHGGGKALQLCRNIASRMQLADSIAGPRLFLAGGSGVRAGVSARIFSEETGLRAINFGFAAFMGPALITEPIRQVARRGDAVLLLLEYPQLQTTAWNALAADIAMTCMTEPMVRMGLGPTLQALFIAGPQRFVSLITGSAEEAMPDVPEPDSYGDRPADTFTPLSPAEIDRVDRYQPISLRLPQNGWADWILRDFAAWATETGVTVYASFPNTIYHPAYEEEPAFDEIRSFYEDAGIHFIDLPSRGLYPRNMFYDTQYHMNYEAIPRRTRELIAAIREEHATFLKGSGSAK